MHISKYLKGFKGSNYVSVLINRANSIEEINDILDSFLKENLNV